jgi:hypothetical protein
MGQHAPRHSQNAVTTYWTGDPILEILRQLKSGRSHASRAAAVMMQLRCNCNVATLAPGDVVRCEGDSLTAQGPAAGVPKHNR